MLVNLKEIIAMAEEGGYCIPAFNVYNTETIMGIVAAAEEAKAPVIIQVYPRLVNEEVGFYLAPAIVAAANRASVPICFHLDHGPDETSAQKILRWGATGIMYDGSVHPFDENVATTKHIVDICNAVNVGVEGELGHIGSVNDETMEEFTDPEEAAKFVEATGVTCLAVLIGNAHGHYKKTPNLDIERVKAIRKATNNTPLVLHGGSGIPDDQVKAAIKAGIRKMNIGTDVCCAFAEGAKAELDNPNRSLAVDMFMKPSIESVKKLALDKIALTGALGKAQDMLKIVGIGANVFDTLYNIPTYPKEDTKMRATASKTAGGGPVATGLVAAGKLGEKTAYIGVLSDDNGGRFLKEDFCKYGVETKYIDVKSGYRSFQSVLWLSADTTARTCVFDKGDLPPLVLNEEQKMAIKNSELLMVDGNELSAAIKAAEIAHESGTKVLYDAGGLYDGVSELLPLTDILIPSEEFALSITGCEKAEDAALMLYGTYRPEVVVITQGKNGGIIFDGDNITEYPAFPVKAVDSNGAGDVFHGAFAAGVIKGYDYLKCCYFASAVSAIKCTGMGARESVPDFETVKKFLKENGYEL